jgi:hypothetical protein
MPPTLPTKSFRRASTFILLPCVRGARGVTSGNTPTSERSSPVRVGARCCLKQQSERRLFLPRARGREFSPEGKILGRKAPSPAHLRSVAIP